MKVRIKKLDVGACVPFKKYERDFAYDVVATSCEKLDDTTYKYGIGLAFDMDLTDYKTSDQIFAIDFRPRSSIYKTGMVLANCVGTIDELYRGEVYAIFYHIQKNKEPYHVGDRIGQILINATMPIDFEVVDELSETTRGVGGFGSTGR